MGAIKISIINRFKNKNGNNTSSFQNIMISDYSDQFIYAPLDGEIVPLKEVPDPVFSEEIMGKGVAIEPKNGNLHSPINGKIAALFPSKHAIGLLSDTGIEVLIHIGIDTVELEGKGFISHVKEGESVSAGQLLISFNIEEIEKKGYPVTTMIVISNSKDLGDLKIIDRQPIKLMDVIIEILSETSSK